MKEEGGGGGGGEEGPRWRGGGGGAGGYHRLGRYLFAPLVILSRDEVALPAQVVWIWEASWIKHDEEIVLFFFFFFFLRQAPLEEASPLLPLRLHARCRLISPLYGFLDLHLDSLLTLGSHVCPVFPSSLGLSSSGPFSSPFTLVHLFALFIFIFPSLPQNSCAPSLPPSVCLSLFLRLSLPLYLSPVSSSETSGAKLCLSLSLHFSLFFCLFLNLSQLFFFPVKAVWSSEEHQRERKSLFQILFSPPRK